MRLFLQNIISTSTSHCRKGCETVQATSRLVVLWLLLVVSLVGCIDDIQNSPVPEPAVVSYSCDIELVNALMQQTRQTQLNSPGGYVRIYNRQTLHEQDRIGNAGLLVVQSLEGGSFYAYDLTCPYCYKFSPHLTRIDIADGLSAICPECESRYGAIFYGSPAPAEGLANAHQCILRQYRATLMGDGKTLVVRK